MILSSGIVLSDVQKRVIDHDKGHLRIVACPGSGKTEVVSRRVANLIKKDVKPSTIVAFTFTEKAAEGLKLRIRSRLEKDCPEKSDFGDMYIGTIDSFCLHILKKIKPEFKSFEVLDSARRIAFIDRWYYRMGFSKLEGEKMKKWRVMKTFCESSDRVMVERIDTSKISNDEFVTCYEKYVEKLKGEKFFDFTSIIFSLLELLKEDKASLKQLNDTIKHVVFDEYQDVNKLQEELLEYLSIDSDSVCVVGDDDQNIFQWRGSNVDYIIDFPENYKKYGVITEKLDVNYRATDGLVETAGQFILNNSDRVPKNMVAYEEQKRKFEHGDIVQHHFDTDNDEFDFIYQNIQNLLNTDFIDKNGNTYGLSYHDMAVLVSTNEDAARIIKYLEGRNVDCIADSGSSVFDRPLVRFATDCICYVFSCPGYSTDDVPVLPTLIAEYSSVVTGGDPKKFENSLLEVKNRADTIIAKGISDWLPNLGLQEFYQRILSAMGAEDGLFREAEMYSLAVLSTTISDFEYVYQTLRAREVSGLKWFILQFAESNYSDPRHDDPSLVNAVRVLTIWKAKGLEFPVVFVPTFVDKRNPPPSKNFVDDYLYEKFRYDGDKEDKRRSFYTAITRSQKYLFLTGAKQRRIVVKNIPSKNVIQPHPFIEEMRNKRFSPLTFVKKPKSKKKSLVHSEGTFPTSYSELSIYDRCPYDYKLRHVMGFNAGVPAAFGYGTNLHNILNLVHSNYKNDQKVPTDKELTKIFDDMFYMRFAPGMQNENMKKAGMVVVKNYIKQYQKDFKRILETEKSFEFVLGDALVSGDIDLLKKVNEKGEVTQVEIIDFKSDKQKEDGKYEFDYDEQVQFYAFAARESLGFNPQTALVHHLDTNETTPVDISDEKMVETKARIEKKIAKIVTRNFKALPEKSKCEGCDFRPLCSEKDFKVGVNFKPVKSAKKEASMRNDDDIDVDAESLKTAPLTPSVISDNMMKRAQKIAVGTINKVADGSFQIPSSSDPDKSYTVTETRCQCKGFRNYSARNPGTVPTCSHIEGIKILKKSKRDIE